MIALGQIRLGAAVEPEAKARCIMVTLENDAAALYTAKEEDEATLAKEGSRFCSIWMVGSSILFSGVTHG